MWLRRLRCPRAVLRHLDRPLRLRLRAGCRCGRIVLRLGFLRSEAECLLHAGSELGEERLFGTFIRRRLLNWRGIRRRLRRSPKEPALAMVDPVHVVIPVARLIRRTNSLKAFISGHDRSLGAELRRHKEKSKASERENVDAIWHDAFWPPDDRRPPRHSAAAAEVSRQSDDFVWR